jgi:hypothetical protein
MVIDGTDRIEEVVPSDLIVDIDEGRILAGHAIWILEHHG